MADPITAAAIGAAITATATLTAAAIAGTIATTNLVYQVGKDVRAARKKKTSYLNSLQKNYEMLEMKLQKLIALAMDMDRAIVITEKVKNSSTFKTWKTRVEEIQTEVRALLNEYESISQSKKKKKVSLSQKMEEKCMEVSGLVEEGTVMIAHF